jgi:hypothetical protein
VTEMQSSPARSTVLELNDSEGVGPSDQGATLSSSEALGPEADKGVGVDEMQRDGLLL